MLNKVKSKLKSQLEKFQYNNTYILNFYCNFNWRWFTKAFEATFNNFEELFKDFNSIFLLNENCKNVIIDNIEVIKEWKNAEEKIIIKFWYSNSQVAFAILEKMI